jgi:hypothetical protein
MVDTIIVYKDFDLTKEPAFFVEPIDGECRRRPS